MSFSCSIHNNDSVAVIQPDIPLESRTCGELKSLSDQLMTKGISKIIIDAEKTDYISSEGLQLLFALNNSLTENGGKLIISRPTHEISSLFKILHLDKYFSITETLEQEFISTGSALKTHQQNMSESSAADPGTAANSAQEDISGEAISLVVECESCGAFVRVNSSGSFLCPSCQTEFSVTADGTVIF